MSKVTTEIEKSLKSDAPKNFDACLAYVGEVAVWAAQAVETATRSAKAVQQASTRATGSIDEIEVCVTEAKMKSSDLEILEARNTAGKVAEAAKYAVEDLAIAKAFVDRVAEIATFIQAEASWTRRAEILDTL